MVLALIGYGVLGLAISSPLVEALPFRRYLLAYYAENPVCGTRHEAGRAFEESGVHEGWMETKKSQISLVRRDDAGFQLWRSEVGEWWFPPSTREDYVRYAFGQYALNAYPGLPIPKGGIVVDAGGFVGDFAKFAFASGASKVVIFEPAEDALECIHRNLGKELVEGKAILVPKGIWDREERLFLGEDTGGNPAANAITDERKESGNWIDVTTLDQALRTLGIAKVDVIKMDIEGAEVRALAGAKTTIQRDHPRLAVATEHTEDRVKNNHEVIKVMEQIEPRYARTCGYCVIEGRALVPQTLYFKYE